MTVFNVKQITIINQLSAQCSRNKVRKVHMYTRVGVIVYYTFHWLLEITAVDSAGGEEGGSKSGPLNVNGSPGDCALAACDRPKR